MVSKRTAKKPNKNSAFSRAPAVAVNQKSLLRRVVPLIAPSVLVFMALKWYFHWFEPTEIDKIIARLPEFDPNTKPPQCVAAPPPEGSTPHWYAAGLYTDAIQNWRRVPLPAHSEEQRFAFLQSISLAAESGIPEAHRLWGALIPDGAPLSELRANPPSDLYITREAVRIGLPWAMLDMATALQDRAGYSHRDAYAPQRLLSRAAVMGDDEGQLALARFYERAGSQASAALMYECAFANGNPQAAYALGVKALSGKNVDQARRYFQRGMPLGCVPCMHWLQQNPLPKTPDEDE